MNLAKFCDDRVEFRLGLSDEQDIVCESLDFMVEEVCSVQELIKVNSEESRRDGESLGYTSLLHK